MNIYCMPIFKRIKTCKTGNFFGVRFAKSRQMSATSLADARKPSSQAAAPGISSPSLRMQFDNPQKRKQAVKQQIVQHKFSQKEVKIFNYSKYFVITHQKFRLLYLVIFLSMRSHRLFHFLSSTVENKKQTISIQQLSSKIIFSKWFKNFSLGLKYADHIIIGSNARCVALLDGFHAFITDYTPSTDKPFTLDLTAKMNTVIQFLAGEQKNHFKNLF